MSNSIETKKTETENESVRAIEPNNTFFPEISPDFSFCTSNCSVCGSGQLEYIHAARKNMKLIDLSSHLKEKFDLNLSKDVLWRHFRNYKKKLQIVSSERMLAQFDEKVEDIAKHQKSTLFLINKSFQSICEHLDNGSLILGVGDYERLISLYYRTLRDPDSMDPNNDLIGIFQRAATRHGFSLEQGVLFAPRSGSKEAGA